MRRKEKLRKEGRGERDRAIEQREPREAPRERERRRRRRRRSTKTKEKTE